MSENNNMRRVVITGLGVIAPNGIGVDEFWTALKAGKSGVGLLTRFDASSFRSQLAAEVPDFKPAKYIGEKKAKRLSLFSQLAIVATKMAMEASGIEMNEKNGMQTGVVLGSACGGMDIAEQQHDIFREKGINRINPLFTSSMIPNAATGEVSLFFKIRGPNLTISTACSSGANAIGYAYDCIRTGKAQVMVAGGVESPLAPLTYGAFSVANQLSNRNDSPEEASRPFERERDGFILGEGAGIAILEDYEAAKARNAPIYAEMVGYGITADAYSMITIDPTGECAAKAIQSALKDAHLSPADVDYINAHGISSILGDRKETNAIKLAFRDVAYDIPVSSIKSMIGHAFGAAGGLQFIATVLALHHQVIPPTINFEDPDPDCDLDYVPNEAREKKISHALLNSFGLGGNNASLIVKKM